MAMAMAAGTQGLGGGDGGGNGDDGGGGGYVSGDGARW